MKILRDAVSRRSMLALPTLAACRSGRQRIIGVVPKATSHLFFVTIHAGVDAAAKEFGVQVVWNGPQNETDHNRQIQIVDSMIAQRVDAIAISATDERALAGTVQRAIDSGIPVAVFDSGVNVERYVSWIATDNLGAGQEAARRLAELVSGSGKVAMVMHKPGGTSTGLREQGFEATMAREFPGVAIAAKLFGMADPAKSRAVAENILTAHPDLKGIFAVSEASSLGTIQALRSRNLAGKVRLVTFDNSDTHVEALRDGTTDLMFVQDAHRLGYEAVRSLVRKLNGEQPVQRMDVPARIVAKSDLEHPDVQSLLTSRRSGT